MDTSTPHVSRLKPETKSKILHMLQEGAEGAHCRIDAEECARMLREARTWDAEQWQTVAKRLRISHH